MKCYKVEFSALVLLASTSLVVDGSIWINSIFSQGSDNLKTARVVTMRQVCWARWHGYHPSLEVILDLKLLEYCIIFQHYNVDLIYPVNTILWLETSTSLFIFKHNLPVEPHSSKGQHLCTILYKLYPSKYWYSSETTITYSLILLYLIHNFFSQSHSIFTSNFN